MIYGVKELHQYVYGRKFVLVIDHKPRIFIFGEKKSIPAMAASREQRWSVFLSAYDYSIKHIADTNNCHSDCLSRLNNEKITSDKNVNDYTHLNCIRENIGAISLDSVIEETKLDKELKIVYKYFLKGWPKVVKEELKSYKAKEHELTIENECLMWGHLLVVPSSLRQTLLEELHSNHMGVVRMKAMTRSYIWWPKIYAAIEDLCKRCKTFLNFKSRNPPKMSLHVWIGQMLQMKDCMQTSWVL